MRSYRSVAMPDTCPKIQLLGSGFGQNGSTWNRGTAVCADVVLAPPMSAIVALSHTIAAFMSSSQRIFYGVMPPFTRGSRWPVAPRRSTCALVTAQCSVAVDGLQRLDRYHARHRLDGAGDLRRHLETSGKLHLHFGALAEHQHQRDLAVVLRGSARSRTFESLGNALDRRLGAQKDSQSLGELGGRLV